MRAIVVPMLAVAIIECLGCGPVLVNPNADAMGGDMGGGDDFRPSWKDVHGCNDFEHWDGAKCVMDNPTIFKNEKTCWDYGQANALGVGRPCQPGVRECTGLTASCCQVDDRHYGAMCTLACTKDSDCGDNAWCSTLSVCMPAFCKAGFTAPDKPKIYTSMGFPCKPAMVAASGLGKTCTQGAKECAGLKAAKCLGDPDNLGGMSTSFCTFECQSDADCGANATCIYADAKPYFCSPNECAAQFANIDFPQWSMPDNGNPVCAKPAM